MLRLGSRTVDIPAGESNYIVDDSFVLPANVSLMRVYRTLITWRTT